MGVEREGAPSTLFFFAVAHGWYQPARCVIRFGARKKVGACWNNKFRIFGVSRKDRFCLMQFYLYYNILIL